LQCVVVWCSVVQCVAVCCSVLQCGAVCCSVLQCVALFCRYLLLLNHFLRKQKQKQICASHIWIGASHIWISASHLWIGASHLWIGASHICIGASHIWIVTIRDMCDKNVTETVLLKKLKKNQSVWPKSQIRNCDILWTVQMSVLLKKTQKKPMRVTEVTNLWHFVNGSNVHIECDSCLPCFCFCLESASDRLPSSKTKKLHLTQGRKKPQKITRIWLHDFLSLSLSLSSTHIYTHIHTHTRIYTHVHARTKRCTKIKSWKGYAVAAISRLLKIIGFFCRI